MGCKTRYPYRGTPCYQSDHCDFSIPPNPPVTVTFEEYPVADIRKGSYNYQLDKRDAVAVMYPSISAALDSETGLPSDSAANCGKVFKDITCTSSSRYYFDYVPNALSFDLGMSDRYFAYTYDTSSNAGHVGIACYYLETRTTTTSNPGAPDDPETPEVDPVAASESSESETVCKPCTSFSCTTAKTNISYSGVEDLTSDPDCPHPTLYAIGTDSNKVVVTYNALSTELPDGVIDMEFSYDGVTYVDAWDENNLIGTPYDSPQNPFVSGQTPLTNFEIYELDSGNSTGLIIKVQIESIYDDTVSPITFSGIRWTITEVLSYGSNYNVGDVFSLTYPYTTPSQNIVTLTMNLRISNVGPIPNVSGQAGFDVLTAGDTLNGHQVTRAFHTDIDNFPYHVIYLDGNGNDFVKDTQYTSNRNHIVTVKAGFGIVDRAMLVGIYEFLDKSIQYMIGDVNKNAPDVFNTLIQPEVALSVTNGRVTGATISSGGEGWKGLGEKPTLVITAPLIASGTQAEAEGTFTNGVLTSIQITNPGSGYSQTNPPQLYVGNIYYNTTDKMKYGAYNPDRANAVSDTFSAYPDGPAKPSLQDLQGVSDDLNYGGDGRTITESVPNITLRKDPERLRLSTLPQTKFSKQAVDRLRESFIIDYDYKDTFNQSDLPNSIKSNYLNAQQDEFDARESFADAMQQDVIPQVEKVRETYIETVQGPFSELPTATTYTKYIVRQFRPDNTEENRITINLSCEVVDPGCAHVPCSPVASVGGSTTDEENTTTTISYSTMQGPLGGGCRNWTASGTMIMMNDLSASANLLGEAIDENGNPFAT